jgi:hypothetical protein
MHEDKDVILRDALIPDIDYLGQLGKTNESAFS